jgi:RimJ/RimL family protein N-acetyltransferase
VESIADRRRHLSAIPWIAEVPTLAEEAIRCRRAAAGFLLRADLPYLAFKMATGRLVASVGPHRTDWQLPKTEIGYWVRSSASGRGYATECVRAPTGLALGGMGAVRVELVTDDDNLASFAVAER